MTYLLWSWRNHAWYAPDFQGYTIKPQKAGIYTWESACMSMDGALPGAVTPVSTTMVNNHLLESTPPEVEDKLNQWRIL